MKCLILSVCVAIVAADVSHILPKQGKDESQAMILKQELDVGVEGRYKRGIETDSGIQGSETEVDVGFNIPDPPPIPEIIRRILSYPSKEEKN